ncbi:50S ribosomal protein L18 [Holosporaceae bacterium 'Namur']|nr:50S ribosomal protein L18 [Holosporaceae bacterium 'Namur']
MLKGKKSLDKRKNRVRFALKKRANCKLRLSVFRSNNHIYAQIIDDINGVTLTAASTKDKEFKGKKMRVTKESAAEVGKLIATRAVDKNISTVIFDRGCYLFQGRIKALADAAREGGLKF